MRAFYHAMLLLLILVLSFKVVLMEHRVSRLYLKAHNFQILEDKIAISRKGYKSFEAPITPPKYPWLIKPPVRDPLLPQDIL